MNTIFPDMIDFALPSRAQETNKKSDLRILLGQCRHRRTALLALFSFHISVYCKYTVQNHWPTNKIISLTFNKTVLFVMSDKLNHGPTYLPNSQLIESNFQ
jgi:hypothetical protein